jgi:hypothetical protein
MLRDIETMISAVTLREKHTAETHRSHVFIIMSRITKSSEMHNWVCLRLRYITDARS